MQIVGGVCQIQVLPFEIFWNFFPNIFDWWLVESEDVESKNSEGQLCTHFTLGLPLQC